MCGDLAHKKPPPRLKRLVFEMTAIMAVMSGSIGSAEAFVTSWTGAVSSDWTNVGNWSNGEPGSGGDLSTTIVLTGSPFASPIISTPGVTDYLVRIDGSGGATGALTITNGGTLTLSRYISISINNHLSAVADIGYQFSVSNDGGGKRDGVKGFLGLRYQF